MSENPTYIIYYRRRDGIVKHEVWHGWELAYLRFKGFADNDYAVELAGSNGYVFYRNLPVEDLVRIYERIIERLAPRWGAKWDYSSYTRALCRLLRIDYWATHDKLGLWYAKQDPQVSWGIEVEEPELTAMPKGYGYV